MPAASLRELIRDARSLAPIGDQIWPGFSDAPFGILLVENDSREVLFCHEGPTSHSWRARYLVDLFTLDLGVGSQPKNL